MHLSLDCILQEKMSETLYLRQKLSDLMSICFLLPDFSYQSQSQPFYLHDFAKTP